MLFLLNLLVDYLIKFMILSFNNNYIYYKVIGGPAKQIGRVNFVANTIPEYIINNFFPIGLTITHKII